GTGVAELDATLVLAPRDCAFHVALRALCGPVRSCVAALEHDVRLHDLSTVFVGHADHTAFGHRLVHEQHALDFGTGEVVAGRNDHVVGARLVEEITVAIPRVG